MPRFRGANSMKEKKAFSPGRLNELFDTLKLSGASCARAMNYDPSYLSRVRSGERIPADPEAFLEEFCRYVIQHEGNARNLRDQLSRMEGLRETDLSDAESCQHALYEWLSDADTVRGEEESITRFLHSINDFDLNQYLKSIRFDEWKVPVMPVRLPVSKKYFGTAGSREAQLDFLKKTVMSPSMEPVRQYSSMPMEEMSKDPEFSRKYIFGLGMCIRKGLRLEVIHNVNRPLHEMLMGLEGWLPLYMTGQVSPFYLPEEENGLFLHMSFYSGSVFLDGETIDGFPEEASYYLCGSKKEHALYGKRMDALFSKARPLLELIPAEQESSEALLMRLEEKAGEKLTYELFDDGGVLFRNIEIRICKGQHFIITKKDNPGMHMVCYHPKVLHAMEYLMIQEDSPILSSGRRE